MQKQSPRREDRAISEVEARKILESGEYGVLTTVSPNGSPYSVPMNYAVHENIVILHCATVGEKLDNIKHNSDVTFCVVGKTEILPQTFTSLYESVIVYGNACVVEEINLKKSLLKKLCEKYLPDLPDFSGAVDKMIEQHQSNTSVITIKIESITGKANRRLEVGEK